MTTNDSLLSFEEEASEVLGRFRSAFADIIAALPGGVTRPQELTRALGIDKKLGWKIANVANSPDPFEIPQHVPGRSGLRIFLNAAKKKNIPAEYLDAAQDAMREYERLVDVHAGDRATLEMMLSSHAKCGRDRVDLDYRRAAFRANSYIWGIQARTQFRTYFLVPGQDPALFDLVSLRGFVGLRRIRAGVAWSLHRAIIVDDDGVQRRSIMPEPLVPAVEEEAYGVPLLPEFCTKPLPKMRRVTVRPGFIDHELIEGRVGNTASATCVMADAVRGGAPRYREEHNNCVELVTRVNTPCEHLIFDQIVHADLFGDIHPELAVYSELAGETPQKMLSGGRMELPVSEQVMFLGRASAGLHATEIPRYTEMTRFVFERMGWDPREFNVYRVHMEYPPIPTAEVVSIELSERSV